MTTIQSRTTLADLESFVDQQAVMIHKQQDHITALETAVAKMQYEIQKLQAEAKRSFTVAPGIHANSTFIGSKP